MVKFVKYKDLLEKTSHNDFKDIIEIVQKLNLPQKVVQTASSIFFLPDMFFELPPEIHAKILINLQLNEIKTLVYASEKLSKIVAYNYLFWSKKHNDNFKTDFLYHRSATTFMNRLRQKILNYQYVKNCVKEVKCDINTNQADITQIFYDNNNRIIASSDDQSIKICNNEGVKHVFTGHQGGIWAFMANDQYLVSGSTDKTVRIWDINKVYCIKVLKGHRSTIRCLKITEKFIISGSRDSEIRVWNFDGDCLHILKGHTESVRCMDIHENLLLTGSYDGSVILWDFANGIKIKNMKTHTARVYCTKISEKYIISSGQCHSIYVSSVQGDLKYILKEHRSIVAWLIIDNNFLLSSGADGLCIKWDLSTGEKIYSIQESGHITVMKLHNNLLILGTNTSVNLYEYKKGTYIRNLLRCRILVYDVEFKNNDIIIGYKDYKGTQITKISYKKI